MFDGRINSSISSSDWRSNRHRVWISRETPVPLPQLQHIQSKPRILGSMFLQRVIWPLIGLLYKAVTV